MIWLLDLTLLWSPTSHLEKDAFLPGTRALRQECIPKGDKKLLYGYLESKLIHRNSEYDSGSILHPIIFHQNHVKISLNINDLKKVCKTRIWYIYMYFLYTRITFRLEFFTDLINCLSETGLFPDQSKNQWEMLSIFWETENNDTCPTSCNAVFTLLTFVSNMQNIRIFF